MIKKYEYLLNNKVATDEDLYRALSISKKTNKSVEATLINNFQIPKEAIGKSLSSYHICDFIAYNPKMPVAEEMFADLNKSSLLNDCWVPISWDENGIVVLVDDPSDIEKKKNIETTFESCPIIYAVGIKEDIETFIKQFFEKVEIFKLFLAVETGKRPIDVPKIVDILFSEAYRKDATDIHFESSELAEKDRVLFRKEGEYREYMTLPDGVANDIVKRIKSMANLDVEDSRLPKIGNIKIKFKDLPEFRISVTTFPNDGLGEVVALKILAIGDSSELGAFRDMN